MTSFFNFTRESDKSLSLVKWKKSACFLPDIQVNRLKDFLCAKTAHTVQVYTEKLFFKIFFKALYWISVHLLFLYFFFLIMSVSNCIISLDKQDRPLHIGFIYLYSNIFTDIQTYIYIYVYM